MGYNESVSDRLKGLEEKVREHNSSRIGLASGTPCPCDTCFLFKELQDERAHRIDIAERRAENEGPQERFFKGGPK